MEVYLSHAPSGTSTQNIIHYQQAYKSHKFQMYDFAAFDVDGNMKHYGQVKQLCYYFCNTVLLVQFIYKIKLL